MPFRSFLGHSAKESKPRNAIKAHWRTLSQRQPTNQKPTEIYMTPNKKTTKKTTTKKTTKKKQVHIPDLKPQWIRIHDAVRVSGLCRSSIYELLRLGEVESFSHRKNSRAIGQRLISYDSLVRYLWNAYKASLKREKVKHVGDATEKEVQP
jgi:cell wall-associated NlpC family hydrolase